MQATINQTMAAHAAVGAPATWVLGNHDVCRPVSRYARPQELVTRYERHLQHYIDKPADFDAGLRRARAGALLSLALPGSAYVYQGEELGLPEVEDIPKEALQDPLVFGTDYADIGRDGCRVPIPWTRGGSSAGFGPDGDAQPWLPQPAGWGERSVEAQDGLYGSTLELYRDALALRHVLPSLGDGAMTWVDAEPDVLAFTRDPGFGCWVNFGAEPAALPEGAIVMLTSAPLVGDQLAPDSAAWLQLADDDEE